MPPFSLGDYEPKKIKPFTVTDLDKDLSKKQEKRVATKVDGKRQPGSGSQDHSKGDVKNKDMLLECKTTEKKSIRLERDWLIKIFKEANQQQKDPGLVVSFPFMPNGIDNDWMVVPLALFNSLKKSQLHNDQEDKE